DSTTCWRPARASWRASTRSTTVRLHTSPCAKPSWADSPQCAEICLLGPKNLDGRAGPALSHTWIGYERPLWVDSVEKPHCWVGCTSVSGLAPRIRVNVARPTIGDHCAARM